MKAATPTINSEVPATEATPKSANPTRVMLLISNLEYGGAQRQVIALANRLNQSGIEAYVVSLSDYVPLAHDLQNAEDRLLVVSKRAKFDITVVTRLAKLMRKLDITVVHSFLLDAEIAARLAAMLNNRVTVIGSERNTDYSRKWRHSLALRLTGGRLNAVIANSNSGKRFQKRTLGIPDHKLFVVHNGVDVERFRPRDVVPLRKELSLTGSEKVVGMFASFKRQKNHRMYFRVARRVKNVHPQVRFLCIGSKLHGDLQSSDRYQQEMNDEIDSMGLQDTVMCLGNRDDVHDVYNLCDVTVLTSQREGTPNVLLESMACGIPVVATDVADNAIVAPDGKVGYIVPLDDDKAMAECILQLLENDETRKKLGKAAREWVTQAFSFDALMQKTLKVYEKVRAARQGVRQ